MAFLVAIEGIDGSGKGTQSACLVDNLQKQGLRSRLISFPRYEETRFGRQIGHFLNGRFGQLNEVHPLLVSLLFAGDRLESRERLLQDLAENDIVVCDRYVASNQAHQGAKVTAAEREELLQWIEFVEYEQNRLPQPNLTLWFDLPVEQAQRLILKKASRSYTQQAADLQEADGAYLAQVQKVYAALARQRPHWKQLNVLCDGELRPIAELAAEACRYVLEAWEAVQSSRDNFSSLSDVQTT